MPSDQNKVWFIDANILAHWVLGKGDVLSFLINKFHLSNEFFDVYSKRYEDSISFVEELINPNYFVTKDDVLIKSAKHLIKGNYGLELINPTQALQILHRRV